MCIQYFTQLKIQSKPWNWSGRSSLKSQECILILYVWYQYVLIGNKRFMYNRTTPRSFPSPLEEKSNWLCDGRKSIPKVFERCLFTRMQWNRILHFPFPLVVFPAPLAPPACQLSVLHSFLVIFRHIHHWDFKPKRSEKCIFTSKRYFYAQTITLLSTTNDWDNSVADFDYTVENSLYGDNFSSKQYKYTKNITVIQTSNETQAESDCSEENLTDYLLLGRIQSSLIWLGFWPICKRIFLH